MFFIFSRKSGGNLFFNKLACNFSQDSRDLTFKTTNSGLTRVLAYNVAQDGIRQIYGFLLKTIFFHLFRDKILFRDMKFFQFRVSRKFYDFHSISKSMRNGIKLICGRYKEYVGKIKRNLKIVIRKGAVLLRIKGLKKRRRRISAKINSNLVYFIKHKYGV